MAQAARHIHRAVFERLDELDARVQHYRLLAALAEFGPASQIELGRRCGLDRSDVVTSIDALVERRFVERTTDPHDRRRNIISLTRRGRARLAELDGAVTAVQDEAFAPLDPADRVRLADLLSRIVDHRARVDTRAR